MIEIAHYGLHRQDNLVFLHEQDRKGRCLSPGLAKLKSPFSLKITGWRKCPHAFPAPEEGAILDHPLVRAMGPAQDGGLYFLPAVHREWVHTLSLLTPGGAPTVEPWWSVKWPQMQRTAIKLGMTNAAPLVITEWQPRDFGAMETLAAQPRIRNLILCGPIRLPGTTLLDPEGLDPKHDWAAEGRRQLYHLIRKGA